MWGCTFGHPSFFLFCCALLGREFFSIKQGSSTHMKPGGVTCEMFMVLAGNVIYSPKFDVIIGEF